MYDDMTDEAQPQFRGKIKKKPKFFRCQKNSVPPKQLKDTDIEPVLIDSLSLKTEDIE